MPHLPVGIRQFAFDRREEESGIVRIPRLYFRDAVRLSRRTRPSSSAMVGITSVADRDDLDDKAVLHDLIDDAVLPSSR